MALILLGLGMLSLALTLTSYGCVATVLRRSPQPTTFPPISILKPLRGYDDELYDNLVSLVRQDYPVFEIVFGCEDIQDPALLVARRLQRDFPDVPISIVAGGPKIGLNPKVNNLKGLSQAARYEYWLISDADIRVAPDYLRAMAAELADPRVGLVSNIICGVGEQTLGAAFDNLHVNTFVASSVCAAELLASHPCVVGKSMLFRRKDFERLDGWNAAKDVLAEDYVLGRLFRQAGFRVALCSHVIASVNPTRSLSTFFHRHLRWSQMRRRIAPHLYWGEPLLMPSLWFLATLIAIAATPGPINDAKMLLGIYATSGLLVKVIADDWLVERLRGAPARWRDLYLGALKDVLLFAIWLLAGARTSVEWRGHLFKIGEDSRLIALEERAPEPAPNTVWVTSDPN